MKTDKNYNHQNHRTGIFTLLALLFCFVFSSNAKAQAELEKPLSEGSFISLLTVTPGSEVYAQYGHTAIRVSDPKAGFDLIFNYGLFDFRSPNFLYKFVKGETDYLVGACSFMDFLVEYQIENRTVTEQVINLNLDEKQAVWQALVKNIQPENRTYRYNFIYNNCSTKPRDILLNAINGRVDYRFKGRFSSLRDEIHFFTEKFPWTQFGIDFTLGVKADDPANLKAQQFAPDVLMESFSKAVIHSKTGMVRSLVLETKLPVKADASLNEKITWTPGPMLTLWVVFAAVVALSFWEIKKGKTVHLLNAILFTTSGLLGFIIAFLVLFSEHPTTDVNVHLLWLQPIHLLFALGLCFPAFRKKGANLYLSINLPLQLFALAGVLFLPQYFHPAMYPLLLCLILRSAMALYSLLKNKSHA